MSDLKALRLAEIQEAWEALQGAQKAAGEAREAFVQSLLEGKRATLTQSQMSKACHTNNGHLSRVRITQYLSS